MSLSDVEICSNALVKIGANPIGSFDEDSNEAEVAGRLYPTVRDALLSTHNWSFALSHAALVEAPQPPATDFTYAFTFPADYIKAVSAGYGPSSRGAGAVYRLVGNELHTDAPAVTLTYVARVAESDLPGYFRHALIARLAAEFCLPLTENSQRAETLAKIAGDALREAKLIDSQLDSPLRIEDFSLIRARLT